MIEIRFSHKPFTYREIAELQAAGKIVAVLSDFEMHPEDARLCGIDLRSLLVSFNPDRSARWEICLQLAETGAVDVICFN